MLKRLSVNSVPAALTFPRTRAAATALSERQGVRTGLWYVLAFLMIGPYAMLRGQADNAGLPVHGAEIEESLFGGLPTIWLQQHIYELAPAILELAAVLVHASWFFIPVIAAFLVTWKRPARIGSFFRWWLLLQATALVLFALFPMEPPWMANPDVIRIIALRHGGDIYDPNQLAAMPSLHVAFPLLIGLWFTRERWTRPAQAMFAYAALVSVEVVFAGEHYVVDVIGAIALALVVAKLASLDYVAALRRLSTRLKRTGSPLAKPAPMVPASPLRSQRAQSVLEFALMAPIVLFFILGIVDFGIAVDRRVVLDHAVREAGRYGAVGGQAFTTGVAATDPEIKAYAAAQSQGIADDLGLTGSDNFIDICYEDANTNGFVGDVGDNIRVSIHYKHDFVTGFTDIFDTNLASIVMSPSANARMERTVSGGGTPC